MCQSQRDGGRRCYAHTSEAVTRTQAAVRPAEKAVEEAERAYFNGPLGDRTENARLLRNLEQAEQARTEARVRYDEALVAHAASVRGGEEMTQEADAIEARLDALLEQHPKGNRQIFRMIDEVASLRSIIQRGMVMRAAAEQTAALHRGNPAAPFPTTKIAALFPPGSHAVARDLRTTKEEQPGEERRTIIGSTQRCLRWHREGQEGPLKRTELDNVTAFRDGNTVILHDHDGPLLSLTKI